MYAEGQTISDKTIFLDGASLHDCKLERCTLVYNGFMNYSMHGCDFSECKWSFNGPAANMLHFFRQIYAQGATEFVDEVYKAIRQNDAIPGVAEDQS